MAVAVGDHPAIVRIYIQVMLARGGVHDDLGRAIGALHRHDVHGARPWLDFPDRGDDARVLPRLDAGLRNLHLGREERRELLAKHERRAGEAHQDDQGPEAQRHIAMDADEPRRDHAASARSAASAGVNGRPSASATAR